MEKYDLYIKANNPSAPRSGQWAKVIGTVMLRPSAMVEMRPCYKIVIKYPDGLIDFCPIYDSGYEYTFGCFLGE